MAEKIKPADTFKGKDGELWINDRQLANIESFEAKVKYEYQEIKVAGSMTTQQVVVGYTVEGSLNTIKVDSSFSLLLADEMKKGNAPDVKLIGKVSNGTVEERVALLEVTFDELTLLKFAPGEIIKEEMPFKAVDYDYIDR